MRRLGQGLANAGRESASLASYHRSFCLTRFARATRPRVSFGKISRMPPRYSVSRRVSVATRGLGTLEQARVKLLHDLATRMTDVIERLGEVGDDVGDAPRGDDVVDPGEVGRVLAQQSAA